MADIPADLIQETTFRRSAGAEKGRDRCRVPLPWTVGGPSFGFGTGSAHLPQPAWFGPLGVEAQDAEEGSTLKFCRRALHWRRRLVAAASADLTWVDAGPDVLHFRRAGGWACVTNFGAAPAPLPPGYLVVASGTVIDGSLPADTTVWLLTDVTAS